MSKKNKIAKENYIRIGVTAIFIVGIIFLLIYIFYPRKVDYLANSTNNADKTGVNEELDSLKDSNRQAIADVGSIAIKSVRAIDDTDHVQGDIDALVQIIVYSDFACPFCAQFRDTLEQAQEEFNESVVIAFRHFPAQSRAYAMTAALVSECAAEQKKFWEMHDKIFNANEAGALSQEQFRDDAVEIRLNQTQFNKCLEEETYKDKVIEQMTEGREAWVTGTPTFFVNGDIYIGAYAYGNFTRSNGEETKGLKSIIEDTIIRL